MKVYLIIIYNQNLTSLNERSNQYILKGDEYKKYFDNSILANITDDMTDIEEEEEIERATKRLVEIDPLDIFQLYIIKVEDDD